MRECHELSAGVGDRRIPRFREQSDAPAVEGWFQQPGQFTRVGVFVEDVDTDRGQLPREPDTLQKRASASGFLHDEAVQAANGLDHRVGQHVAGLACTERRWDQKQSAARYHRLPR